MLRKRFVIETINDRLKDISQIEHSRHRSLTGFIVNLDVHFVNPTPVHSGLGKVYNWGHCHVLDLFPLS
jgi:hypothetical protein